MLATRAAPRRSAAFGNIAAAGPGASCGSTPPNDRSVPKSCAGAIAGTGTSREHSGVTPTGTPVPVSTSSRTAVIPLRRQLRAHRGRGLAHDVQRGLRTFVHELGEPRRKRYDRPRDALLGKQRIQRPQRRMHAVRHRRARLQAPRDHRIDVHRVDVAGPLRKARLIGRGEDASS